MSHLRLYTTTYSNKKFFYKIQKFFNIKIIINLINSRHYPTTPPPQSPDGPSARRFPPSSRALARPGSIFTSTTWLSQDCIRVVSFARTQHLCCSLFCRSSKCSQCFIFFVGFISGVARSSSSTFSRTACFRLLIR